MTNIKRLTELAGLNEYIPSDPFIKLERVADDALSQYNGINNTDPTTKTKIEPLEKVVQYHAMKNSVDYEELLRAVDRYVKNPEKLMPAGAVSQMGEDSVDNETITFSVNDEEGYNAIMDRYKDHISWDGEYMVASEVVFARIEDLFASMGIDSPHEVGSEDDYDGQPTEREEWQDYMGGDDWDQGQYDEDADLGRMYEEYQEQLAFEQFQKDLDEAVRFGGDGEPPQTRVAAQADRYTRPGTFDNPVTDQPTDPHAKTVISDKEPWEYTGDLGSSLGLKQKIDPENYASVLSRDFSKWVKGMELKSNKTRTVYDRKNNKQIKSTVWHPKGRHEDIVAFQILSGAAGNFAPGVYVRKDAAPSEMIQRGRESGR